MKQAKQISFCAMLIALALALSYAERWIPLQWVLPLPGVKLGLANVVTLLALYLLRTRYAVCIVMVRCLLGAIFGGGITGLAFSLCGGAVALAVMVLAKKVPFFSIFGVSVLGAAAHSLGQILVAMGLMHSVYVGAYLTWLLPVSVVTGLVTAGLCAGVLRILPVARITIPDTMRR